MNCTRYVSLLLFFSPLFLSTIENFPAPLEASYLFLILKHNISPFFFMLHPSTSFISCLKLIRQDMVTHFLSLTTTNYYDSTPSTNTCPPLLSISITMDTRPGTPAQRLHRDDKNHHARHTASTSYSPNRDILLGLFVPGCDTTKANGATRVVPGSHLWGDSQPSFIDPVTGASLVVDAELKKGEAFMMLGSLYHGAGEYSLPEGNRMVHIMFCCSGNLRVEEISWLVYPKEEVKGWSSVVRERLGWVMSEPNLGWVDLQNPEVYLTK
jgi:hypothetical protein